MGLSFTICAVGMTTMPTAEGYRENHRTTGVHNPHKRLEQGLAQQASEKLDIYLLDLLFY